MQESAEIAWRGFGLEVVGEYTPASLGDHNTPGEPATLEIDEILFNKVDVSELLLASSVNMFEIEELALEKITDQQLT